MSSDPEGFKTKRKGDFSIGQSYTRGNCKTVFCKHCKSNKMLVGLDDWFVAIKCAGCGRGETCIADG